MLTLHRLFKATRLYKFKKLSNLHRLFKATGLYKFKKISHHTPLIPQLPCLLGPRSKLTRWFGALSTTVVLDGVYPWKKRQMFLEANSSVEFLQKLKIKKIQLAWASRKCSLINIIFLLALMHNLFS